MFAKTQLHVLSSLLRRGILFLAPLTPIPTSNHLHTTNRRKRYLVFFYLLLPSKVEKPDPKKSKIKLETLTFAIFDRKLKAPLFACADRCKRLTGIIGAKCDTREIMSGRRYSRSKKFPRKTFILSGFYFHFRKNPRPIPIPVQQKG
jgi:hypothetical protein